MALTIGSKCPCGRGTTTWLGSPYFGRLTGILMRLSRSSFLCARKGVLKTTKQGHSDRDGSRKLLLLGIQQHGILCLLDRYGHLWRDAEKAISRFLCDRVGNEAVDDALEIQLVEVLELGFRRLLILIQPHRLR